MEISEHIQDANAAGCVSPEEVTDYVLPLLAADDLRRFARTGVMSYVLTHRRAELRAAEESALPARVAADMSASGRRVVVSRVQALVQHSFALPDGRWVPWLEATAEDHLQRAAWMRGKAATMSEDAARHEAAAAAIRSAGVSCLGDIKTEHPTGPPKSKDVSGARNTDHDARGSANPISASRRGRKSENATSPSKPMISTRSRETLVVS